MQYKSPKRNFPTSHRSSPLLLHSRSSAESSLTNYRKKAPYAHVAGADESHTALVKELFFAVYRNTNEFRAIVGLKSLTGLLLMQDENEQVVVKTLRRLRSVVHPDNIKRRLEANGGFDVSHVEVMFFAEVLTLLYTNINTHIQSLLERKQSLHRFRFYLMNDLPDGPDPVSVSSKIHEWCIATRSGKLSNPTSDYEQTVAACMDAYVRDYSDRPAQTPQDMQRQERERIARLERERIARLERERIAQEQERIAKEQERIARLEQERIAAQERERIARLEHIARLEREHIARLEQERIARLEQERIAQEQMERLEQERIARLDRERIAQEQMERLEQERIARETLHPGHVGKHETKGNAKSERCPCRKLTKAVCKTKPGCKWTIGAGCRVDASLFHVP